MKNVCIGPLIQQHLLDSHIDQALLAANLGLTPGGLYDLLLQDDLGILHLIRISEALGVNMLAYVGSQVNLEDLMAGGAGLYGHAVLKTQRQNQN